MIHVAIMNKKIGLIDTILSGSKQIESRFLKNKSTPFGRISRKDILYFKDSGGSVRAQAEIEKVIEYKEVDITKIGEIVSQFGGTGGIDLVDFDYQTWGKDKKYAVLIFLKNPRAISPFQISKNGFGSGAAWLTTDSIEKLKL